jgi:hypothetical protein
MADQLEVGVAEKVRDVPLQSGEEIIETKDVMTVRDEPVAEVGAYEARPPVTRTRFGVL